MTAVWSILFIKNLPKVKKICLKTKKFFGEIKNRSYFCNELGKEKNER